MTINLLARLTAFVLTLVIAGILKAADLTGAWNGLLSSPDGSQAEVQIDFSLQGFPLYSYTNSKGLTRQVELSHAGQTVQYIPPGGGVQRMVVQRVDKGQGQLSVGLLRAGESELSGSTAGSRPDRHLLTSTISF